MKVLFLTQTYPRHEGDTSGPFIRDLARGLVRRGDAVTVLTPHAEGLGETWDDGGVTVHTFRYAPESFEVLGYSRSLDRDETIRPLAGLVAPLYALAARRAAARQLRSGDYDLLHAHWVVPNGIVAGPLGRRVRLAVGLHGSDVFLAEKGLFQPFVRRALARTRVLTGCSPELVDRVCAVGFPKERSRVIPYGVDEVQFSPEPEEGSSGAREWREKLGIPPEAPTILTVGRMATKKGYQHLMPVLGRLFDRCPDAHLVLAGGGDRLEEWRRQAAPYEKQVHFPGAVYRDTLPDLYRAADVFVLPAVHDPKGNVDGLPNVILEAMASGLPVVASAISGIPLAVEDGITGLHVPEADGEALLQALGDLAASAETRRLMGAAGRRKVEAELTWDAVAARYSDAYDLAFSEDP